MKKKILILFTIIVVAIMAISLVACNDYQKAGGDDTEEDPIARTMMIDNGTFYEVDSSNDEEDYLKQIVSGWTGTKGSLNTGDVGVVLGVVDLGNNDGYDSYKDNLVTANTTFENPGIDPNTPYETDDDGNITDQRQDTNALVIASNEKDGSLYYKTSTSVSLEADKYYKLSYSVCTNVEATEDNIQNKGAWVTVSGGLNYEDACINTDGKWETHTLLIRSNKNESKKIDIRLWFGNGPAMTSSYDDVQDKTVLVNNPYLTKGAVMFDNIICEEVEESYVQENKDDDNTGFRDMYYLTNNNLDESIMSEPQTTNATKFYYSFREGAYSSNNVNGFEMQKGKKDITTNIPSVNTPNTGIVDLSKLYNSDENDLYKSLLASYASSYSSKWEAMSYNNWKNNVIGDSGNRTMSALDETKALMISLNDLSGVGFTSTQSLQIESNKYYKISLWTYVYALDNLPETDKISEPIAYTDWQAAIKDAHINPTNYALDSTYFDALTTEETAKINDYVATNDDDATVVAYLAWLVDNQSAYRKNDSGKTDKEKEVATELEKFYLELDIDKYETVLGASVSEALNDYLENKRLNERKALLAGEDYKKLIALEKTWDDYNNDTDVWLSKYNSWLDATSATRDDQKPFATVKLTGAGDDIEKTTQGTELDKWNQIEFYVLGNQLSDRNLTLEMWFGEGTSTEYTSLMMGGAIFDNIEITEYSKADAQATGENFTVLNKMDAASQLNELGSLADASKAEFDANWELALASDEVASNDENSITLTRNNLEDDNFDLAQLKIDTGIADLYELVLENQIATASMLTSKEYISIKPNTAYRIAMLVKTDGIKDGLGAEIKLLGGDDSDDLTASITQATSINSEEWQEIVFYVLGDTLKKNYVSLEVIMGTGTRFDTASYVKGKISIALINVLEIKYSEYTASDKSGDITNSYSFSNATTPSNIVTNGNFANIDLTDTEKEEFDNDGLLTTDSTATTKSWTEATVKNNIYTAPKIEKTSGNISWDKVWGISENEADLEPSYYEIWIRYKDSDDKYQEKYLTAIAAPATDEVTFALPKLSDLVANYRVRAIGKSNAALTYIDVVSNFSNYSGEVQKDTTAEAVAFENYVNVNEPIGYVEKECKAGTFAFDKTVVVPAGSYVSPYDTGLKISSNYSVVKTMTSSSSSLDSNSYYRVGVWVKTVDDAKASVTMKNVNNVLRSTVSDKYIGFTGINTNGSWVEYVFYIQVGNNSGSLSLELSLGNPYLTKVSKKNAVKVTSDVTVYESSMLSYGTVLFDNVQLLKIEEEEFNIANSKEQVNASNEDLFYDYKLSDINPNYSKNDYTLYTNKYALRILECTIDSFDSFTENTLTGDGENLGASPKNYSWTKASDSTGTVEDNRMYGVYSQTDDLEKLNKIYKNDEGKNTFSSITDLPDDFDIQKFIKIDGSNSLVMSNKTLFGQSYKVSSTSSIEAGSYYKVTFKAKTLIAKQAFDVDGNAITNGDNEITYTMEKVNAEFRFMQQIDTTEYQSLLINSKGKVDSIYDAVEYTMYIYNPSKSASTANWSFALGDNVVDEDATGVHQMVIGAMVVDQVSLVKIDEEAYLAAKSSTGYDNLTDEQKMAAVSKFYEYSEDEEVEKTDDDTDTEEPKEPKTSIWDRGDAWLLISSIVIGVVIIFVIVILLFRRWKKKHPKEVIGESKLKVEEIKVIPTNKNFDTFKADDEYSDEKPIFVQRKVDKSAKSKRKK